MIRKEHNTPKRNDACPCGSGAKFKKCCGCNSGAWHPTPRTAVTYIDSGETAIRWVICDAIGISFFSTAANQILVFTDKAVATAIAALEEFSSHAPGEINVAGVGPTKLKHLFKTLPYVEVSDVDQAAALVRERLTGKTQEGAKPNDDKNQDQAQAQEES
jgi:hypothetical protein